MTVGKHVVTSHSSHANGLTFGIIQRESYTIKLNKKVLLPRGKVREKFYSKFILKKSLGTKTTLPLSK